MANGYRIEWDRPIETSIRIDFGNPTGAQKPRRVTAQHVHSFNQFMEHMARTWWEAVDKKKPYAVEDVQVETRYVYVAVDTSDDAEDVAEAESA